MSSSSWRRPVGAAVDVKELEYVSALHQTCLPACRKDATVSSVDVCRLLRSRFALEVPREYAIRILQTLGGGVLLSDATLERILEEITVEQEQQQEDDDDDDMDNNNKKDSTKKGTQFAGWSMLRSRLSKAQSIQKLHKEKEDDAFENEEEEDMSHDNVEDPEQLPEEYLDLVQLLAILLIPTLARAGKEWFQPEQEENDFEMTAAAVPQDGAAVVAAAAANSWRNPWKWYRQRCADRKAQQLEQKRLERESLRPKPPHLIRDVLPMMLQTQPQTHGKPSGTTIPNNHNDIPEKDDEEGGDGPVVMNANLVQTLLQSWGEHERAYNENLIRAMVEAAGGEGTAFTPESFCRALTSDLKQWEVGVEDRLSTTHFDVWGFDSRPGWKDVRDRQQQPEPTKTTDTRHDDDDDDEEEEGKRLQEPYVPRYPPAAVNIDFAVDCHASVALTAVIWVFFVCTALLYTVLLQDVNGPSDNCNTRSFGCRLFSTVWVWFSLAIVLSFTGLVVIVPLSLGNTPVTSSPKVEAFCFLCAAAFTYIPYITVVVFRDRSNKDDDEPYNAAEATVNEPTYDNTQNFLFAIGNAVMFAFVIQFLIVIKGRQNVRSSTKSWVRQFFTTSNARGSWRTKQAATRKINDMLQNAHALHFQGNNHNTSTNILSSIQKKKKGDTTTSSSTDDTMLNFVLHGERQDEETCGGLFWTWKRIWNGQLFDTEGVWINSRIIVFQTAQVIFAVILTYGAFEFTNLTADRAERAWQDLQDLEIDNLPQWIYDLVPTRNEVYAALYPANGVLILVMVTIWLIYIPSAVATTLKYRCGIKPSLTSRLFNTYRGNPDTVYLNIGNAIYGMVGSAVLFWALTALVIFLFVWDFSQDFMILVVAWALGLIITIVLKMIATRFCRKKYYAAFYRTKPLSANLSLLALECWFIGLGGGILVGRFTQFILAACFWVGRTDCRFLDQDVNLVGYGFDYVPFNFEKDLLGHEAHRHPYIERLGAMYMMKLKDDEFCTEAGACWRQLFVVSLMPWMMKYRVFNDGRLTDAVNAASKRRARMKKDRGLLEDTKDFGEDLVVGLATGGMGERQSSEVKLLPDA